MDSYSIRLISIFLILLAFCLYLGYQSHKRYMAKRNLQKIERGSFSDAVKFFAAIYASFIVLSYVL